MWPFKKTVRQRRIEARKAALPRESAWCRFCRAGGIGATLFALALWAGSLAVDLYPVEPFPYRAGQYVPEDLHARVEFRVPLNDLIDKAKLRARSLTPAVFHLDQGVVDEIAQALKMLPRRVTTTTQPADPNQQAAWKAVADDPNALKAYHERVGQLVEGLPRASIVHLKDAEVHNPQLRWPQKVQFRSPGRKVDKEVTEVLDLREADALVGELARVAGVFAEPLRKNVEKCLLGILRTRPLYRYDPVETQSMIDRAEDAVEADPPDEAYRKYAAGERIVQRSARKDARGQREVGLAPTDLDVLRAEHNAYCAAERAEPWRLWERIIGRAAILLLASALLGVYTARYHWALVKEPGRTFFLVVTLLVLLAMNEALTELLRLNLYVSVLPVLLAGAILAIACGQRFALATGAMLAMLVVLQIRGSIELFLVLLAGLSATVFLLGEIRTRTKLLRVAAVAGVAVFAGVMVVGMASSVPWKFAAVDAAWAAGGAVLMGLVAQGILPLIEGVFHVATSLTLLEWCDASKPLLRRLAMEAPGTYNHSLQLGAMCEAAAESIGARGLLARVGAYYHDIGKINKADYFIENQSGTASRHAKLSPAMSLLVIIGHVKDGAELAREYGLPKVLHEFIASHHGTTLVQYFYQAATEQRKDNADRAPDEMEFRYPGPKPHSKESAILMLADAAESSVRAMSEPTPGRIETQVNTMVSRRLMDGQLDECDLTLSEVHQIESSLIKSLFSMFHSRITYPTPAGQKPAPGEQAPRPPAGANGDKNGKPTSGNGADKADRPDRAPQNA